MTASLARWSQSFKPILFNGFCMSAYPVTSKSGFLQEANIV